MIAMTLSALNSVETKYANSFILSHFLSIILSSRVNYNFLVKLFKNKKLMKVIFRNLSTTEIRNFLNSSEAVLSEVIGSDVFGDWSFDTADDGAFLITDAIRDELSVREKQQKNS